MLSIGAMGSGQGTYYIGLAREDYYLEGGEPPGHWLGRGADHLGLTENGGVVDRESFLRLFAGYGQDGEPLVQNAGDARRQPGWDLTFSAPKSVSLIWALSDGDTRQAIAEAHHAAVKEAAAFLEEGATTRRGKAGVEHEKAALVIATFEHGTSRAQDPQLHTHALVLNVAVRESDGTTGTVESKPLYQSKMTAGALYRAELSHRLENLGYAIERDGTSFAVKGVPRSLVEGTSKRRAEIEAVLEARGDSGARAAAFAALGTRSVKEHASRDTLFGLWCGVGEQHGFGAEAVQALRQTPGPERPQEELRTEVRAAMEAATARVTRERSHFGERDLLRAMSEEAQGRGLWASLVQTAVRHELGSNPNLVCLGDDRTGRRYTTHDLFDNEKRLLGDVDALRQKGTNTHSVDERTLNKAVGATEREETRKARGNDPHADARTMNAEQKAALTHITRGPGDIAVVSGMAGTGKTFLLQAAREAWEQSGYTVIGAAVAGKAARGLQEGAGIESRTLASLLWQPDHLSGDALKHHAKQLLRAAQGKTTYRLEGVNLDSRTVVVVDEAGMVGTRDMARLTAKVKEAGAKLVLVGDAQQLQPVKVGGPFRAIEERIGSAKLTNIVRQELDRNDRSPMWRREAVTAFAEGRAEEALRAYQERGLLSISEDRKGAMQDLIHAWKEKGTSKPAENLIIAGTRQEVRELNGLAQSAREADGKLGIRSIRVNGETIRERDRVLITRNDRVLNVNNGDLGTVQRLEPLMGRMSVKLDDGREVKLPYRQFEHIELGYATTTHKGQGATVKNAFVLCGGHMTDLHMSYVQVSRARQNTYLFTERINLWNPETERREDRTLDVLSRCMSQDRQREMAHDLVKQSARHLTACRFEQEVQPT